MPSPRRGEVWLVNLGMAAKIRPCMVLSIPADADTDRALTALVPHTTSPRHSQFEVPVSVKFLKAGVFDTQNIITIPRVKLMRKLGQLNGEQLADVAESVRRWLGL